MKIKHIRHNTKDTLNFPFRLYWEEYSMNGGVIKKNTLIDDVIQLAHYIVLLGTTPEFKGLITPEEDIKKLFDGNQKT